MSANGELTSTGLTVARSFAATVGISVRQATCLLRRLPVGTEMWFLPTGEIFAITRRLTSSEWLEN